MTAPEGTVRVAWAEDAPDVARLQLAEWRTRFPELASAFPDEAAATAAWRESLQRPGDARNRVLVALAGDLVCGLAVMTPADDPDSDPITDAELTELIVAPGHRRQGHGARLLHAVADTLRADRFTRAVAWVTSTEDDGRRFLADSGWAPDGAHRELDAAGVVRLKQIRLHTSLA